MIIFVKPAKPELLVRHPEKLNFHIPADGCEVEDSKQWQRLIAMGDVVCLPIPATVSKVEDKK